MVKTDKEIAVEIARDITVARLQSASNASGQSNEKIGESIGKMYSEILRQVFDSVSDTPDFKE